MSSTLRPCLACHRHVRDGERACPFCGSGIERSVAAQAPTSPRPTTRAAIVFAGATAIAAAGAAGCQKESSSEGHNQSSSSGVVSSSGAPVPPYSPAPIDAAATPDPSPVPAARDAGSR